MKPLLKLILFLSILFFAGCQDMKESLSGKVDYQAYYDYYCTDKSIQQNSTTVLKMNNKAEFDSKFMMIFDHSNPITIPESDFKTKKAIAIVKMGNKSRKMSVNSVYRKGSILYIDYNDNILSDNMSWNAIQSTVITLDCSYDGIKLIENGKEINY